MPTFRSLASIIPPEWVYPSSGAFLATLTFFRMAGETTRWKIWHVRFNVTVALENDGGCFGIGEASAGAGRGKSPIGYVTVGTGIGGGIIFDGQLIAARDWPIRSWSPRLSTLRTAPAVSGDVGIACDWSGYVGMAQNTCSTRPPLFTADLHREQSQLARQGDALARQAVADLRL